MQEKIKGYNIPRGDHVAAVTTLGEVRMIALVYCARSDNSKKANAKKANYKLFFGQTECDSTLPGIPAEKKLHHTDGTKATSKFIDHYKFVEEYYAGMSASDIVTCNSQFLLCIEDSV